MISLFAFKTLQILGLEICADILVGDEMVRGISGGQKKRVTTGKISDNYGIIENSKQSLSLLA